MASKKAPWQTSAQHTKCTNTKQNSTLSERRCSRSQQHVSAFPWRQHTAQARHNNSLIARIHVLAHHYSAETQELRKCRLQQSAISLIAGGVDRISPPCPRLLEEHNTSPTCRRGADHFNHDKQAIRPDFDCQTGMCGQMYNAPPGWHSAPLSNARAREHVSLCQQQRLRAPKV